MFEIFLSYRRGESAAVAGRISDRLGAHFGDKHVFMDIDDLRPGENFALELQKALERCGAFLVLIGPSWAGARDREGARRLDDPNDFVRMEVRTALEKGTRVLPVLVEGAAMPKPSELPAELAGLLRHQAHEVTHERFRADMDRLIAAIEESVGFGWHSVALSGPLRQLFLVVVGVSVAVGLYLGATSFANSRKVGIQVRAHLGAGDRFFADGDYLEARSEYEEAIAIDPTRAPAMRRLVSALTQQLLVDQFAYPSGYDIGLPELYFDPYTPSAVADSSVTDALGVIYRLRSMDRRSREDVGLLFDEARVLKSVPWRVAEAIPVLEHAHELAPQDPDVLAELGLVKAVAGNDPAAVEFIRQALRIEPANARYHFYLARVAQWGHACAELPGGGDPYRGPVPGAAAACATAVRELRRVRGLAVEDGPPAERIGTRATDDLVDIFGAFAWRRFENAADTMDLSPEEQTEFIDELLAWPYRDPEWRWPEIWLVVLHHARGDLERAGTLMSAVVADWVERRQIEDDPYGRMPPSWVELYARILRASGQDPGTLRELDEQLERRRRAAG
jgi:tetratricopeptide (TPR) repeat protein